MENHNIQLTLQELSILFVLLSGIDDFEKDQEDVSEIIYIRDTNREIFDNVYDKLGDYL